MHIGQTEAQNDVSCGISCGQLDLKRNDMDEVKAKEPAKIRAQYAGQDRAAQETGQVVNDLTR